MTRNDHKLLEKVCSDSKLNTIIEQYFQNRVSTSQEQQALGSDKKSQEMIKKFVKKQLIEEIR